MQDQSLVVNTLGFAIEVTYNVLILLVLSLSLVHYLYHETKHGLLLFLASVPVLNTNLMNYNVFFVRFIYF